MISRISNQISQQKILAEMISMTKSTLRKPGLLPIMNIRLLCRLLRQIHLFNNTLIMIMLRWATRSLSSLLKWMSFSNSLLISKVLRESINLATACHAASSHHQSL